MHKSLLLISMCLSLMGFTSCSPQPHSVTHPVKSGENLLISSSAAVSSGLLRDSDDIKHYCASVAPDATFNETVSEGASISMFNFGRSSPEKEVVSDGIKETQMVGRTPAVLVSREILYRVCELTGNRSLTNEETLKLYEKSIEAIVQLASQEMANTSISLEARSGTDRQAVRRRPAGREPRKPGRKRRCHHQQWCGQLHRRTWRAHANHGAAQESQCKSHGCRRRCEACHQGRTGWM